MDVNCLRIIYIENAWLKMGLDLNKSIVTANCFVNIHHIKAAYCNEINERVNYYCPEIFKNGIHIPQYYKLIIKNTINN